MDKVKVIDLFCGAGGLSYGLSMAGYEIIAAIDNCKSSLETYRKNHDVEYVLNRNLNRNDLTPTELKRIIGNTTIDFVVGGPPCQGFSKASMNPKARPNYGKGSYGRRDSRRSLYRQFFDYISYFKPRVFLMENVPSFKTKTNGYYRKQIEILARKLDYSIEFVRLNAAKYGVPQKRHRLFVIGVQDGGPIPQIEPSHDKNADEYNSYYSVGDAILLKMGKEGQ
jgi:DNA (cytosine-5)-methyltransferase 1